ncbi:MAG: DMT family transporter [Pseudomonadota bacterium]
MARTTTTIRSAGNLEIALLVGIAIIWASAFIGIKIAVEDVTPLWLAAFRVLVGFAVLLPYALWRGLRFPKSQNQWTLLFVMAMFNVTIPFFLISWAQQTIDAGVTSLLMGTGPFFALLGSHVFTDDDKITGRKLTAVLCGILGVIILVGGDALQQVGAQNTVSQLAVLCGSLCYVTAGLILRRIALDAVSMAVLALGAGATVLLIAALTVDGLPPGLPGQRATLALIYLGLFPTGIAYILRFYLIREVGYSTFSLSINLIPVFGVILGFLVLSEPLDPQVLIALALVMVGLFIARPPKLKSDE